MPTIERYRKNLNSKLAELQTLRAQLESEEAELTVVSRAKINLQSGQQIAQEIAQGIQQKAHKQIASVVCKCLNAVFDEPYRFIIHFEQVRGRTEAVLRFERNGEECDPMTASGGGVVDVAAFALRLACLMLSRPKLRRVVVMDEPFKFVSEEFQEAVQRLLKKLSEEMKVQFIMVTHITPLVTGRVIRTKGKRSE